MLARLSFFVCLLSIGCSSASAPSTTSGAKLDGYDDPSMPSCDPLSGAPLPISLGTLVGAGKHADGTVYAIDKTADYRTFVSSGQTLQRVVVDGSGVEGTTSITMSVAKPAEFTLKVELEGGVAKRMGVLRGPATGKTFDIGTTGDVLELLPNVDGFTLKNLPGNSIIESTHTTADGHRLAVVRPENDWTYADFRVFYGTDARMVERPVLDVQRGSATQIRFMLDGKEADAFLASDLFTPGISSTLSVGGTSTTLTEGSTAAKLSFVCR